MITVYYDGKCGLCSKEINHYKKIADNSKFNWVDITVDDAEFKKCGFKLTEGLKFLHAKDGKGNFYKGVDAFILIWKNIKYWKILGHFAALPIIKNIADFLYSAFAKRRFNKLEHCQIAAENEAEEKGQ